MIFGDISNGVDAQMLLGEFRRDLYFPRYREMAVGPWNVRIIGMPAGRGYWGGHYHTLGTVIMMGPTATGGSAWMSMTPSELESQEVGLGAARGHTVVLGLGMGWLAANVAMRPEVDRVTVVERDPNVVALIDQVGVFSQLPAEAREKVSIVQADALEWRPDTPVDTLQADIWLKLLERRKLDDVHRMQANVQAESVYFWGQELEIWRYACRRADAVAELDWPTVRTIVEEDLRLPLILPDWEDYPERIANGVSSWAPQEYGWWRGG